MAEERIPIPTPPRQKTWWENTKEWARERPVVAGAGTGAAGGALAGSVIPGIGTGVGAVVGGIGGAVSGYIHKRNKV